MPALLPALVAKTAVATAAPAVIAPTVAATTTAAAGKTAALELAKQKAIEESMRQMAAQGAKQATAEAVKQKVGTEVAKQGIAQAGQQTGVEAMKQGIFSNPAGVPPTAGAPITPAGPATPLAPAGNAPQMTLEQQLAQIKNNPTDLSKFPKYEQVATGPGGQTQLVEKAATQPVNSSTSPFKNPFDLGNAPPELTQRFFPNRPPLDPNLSAQRLGEINAKFPNLRSDLSGQVPKLGDPGTFSRIASDPGITTTPVDKLMGMKETAFPLAPESALERGVRMGLDLVKEKPLETGLASMAIGQYMNRPEKEDEDKYKSTVDMSEFQPSVPTQRPFTRSYEYQSYQAGGPVEDMSRMNSIGANTGYPMARLQTPAYAVSSATPMPVNALTPSADAPVDAYSGAARFASGGLSAAERREYGLSTRGQKAARGLSQSYEEMEEARQREAMKLFNESSLPTPRPIARSRTQELSSPFSAAETEYARLAKKAKVPVIPMPKTNLGDIDNYMDIPIEAAGGGIMHGLGGYSDGGRLLRGPGDGVSDSIPAVIGKRQPARLADGEFVIPARIVSELGNGSTEAGARKLYAMMERVQRSRKKSIGKKKVAVNSKADKHLPA